MPNTRANTAALLAPEQVESLLVLPALAASVAANPAVTRVVRVSGRRLRVPRVTADPSAAWVAEGAEIPASDLGVDDVVVDTYKVAGLSVVTSELVEDSSPEATEEVGNGLARDLARKVDAAYFAASTVNGPAGLASLTTGAGVGNIQDIAAGTAPSTFDAFAQAQSLAAGQGAVVTAFVANPTNALTFRTIKEASGSAKPVLGPDPSQPTRNLIYGVPLVESADCPAGTIWALAASRVVTAVSREADVQADASVFFTSDRVAVRATMRVGFGFVHPRALVRIRLAAS